MQIRITDGEGQPTELIAFAESDPKAPAYLYTDVDADRLVVFTAVIPDLGPGINVKTDQFGASFPLADVAALVDGIWSAAQQAAHEQGVVPCPHPRCGPCSFDRAIPPSGNADELEGGAR
jgi:hypothetical protein